MDRSNLPSSVYRLQLNRHFTLRDAIEILPYLHQLGIEAIYCSPIFDAFGESGYDVTNPNAVNPALGTLKDYQRFCDELKKLGMGQIIDVIPNHMGIRGGKNFWWQDVLEHGPHSEFASFFDIHWFPEKIELKDRVLLPILGEPYGKILEGQELKLHYKLGKFSCLYHDYTLPISPLTYPQILEHGIEELPLAEDDPLFKEYKEHIAFYRYYPITSPERLQKKQEREKKFIELLQKSKELKKFVLSRVALFNGKKHLPSSFDLMDQLLESQFYRLSYWRVASHEINYRRFFNINELAALRIEDPKVLQAHHAWIFKLLETNQVQGIRIDHPDGLYDPRQYFERIKKRFPTLIIVEKILDQQEELPSNWEVEGTVGYEYINLLNGLFVRKECEEAITEIYERFVGEKIDFQKVVYESKKMFTEVHMVSEIEGLGLTLDRLSEKSRAFRDFTRHDLTLLLQEVIANFPVYRTYISTVGDVSKRDSRYIHEAIDRARKENHALDDSLFHFLEKILLIKLKIKEEEIYREFILRFQQLTAPIMAKGMEDTAFYIYNRFISLNEVGGDPAHFGYFPSDFHRFNRRKKKKWPYGFLSTSTHDTKRSGDVRMRLNVLSEIPDAWNLQLKKWREANGKVKKTDSLPSPNTEYYLYQTLVGAWPSDLTERDFEAHKERMWGHLMKAVREAGKESSWRSPNLEYEEKLKHFLFAILTPESEFLKHFLPFQKRIDRWGAWNSLSETALKLGGPGIVDVYQGEEIWNYQLVDPDNRTPVDFEKRKETLSALKKMKKNRHGEDLKKLFSIRDYGKIKMFLHWKTLNFRRANRELFLEGEYIPLRVKGQRKDNLIAFLREWQGKCVIVMASRFFAQLINTDWGLPLGSFIWGDTELLLPLKWRGKRFTDLFTKNEIMTKRHGGQVTLSVAEALEHLPFAYLIL